MSDLDPELERLFQAARREEDPTDEDRRAVRSALGARLATAAAAGAAVTLATRVGGAATGVVAAKASLLGSFALGLAAGAVVGGTMTAVVLYRDTQKAPASAPQASARVTAVPPARAPAPPTSAAVPAPAASAREAPSPTLPSVEKTAAAPSVAPSALPSLEEESRALGEVQRALRDDRPDEALRLLGEQERTFARGALHEERAAARVLALCGVGRTAEGRVERDRFLASYPRSPAADRVRSSCAP